MTESARVEELKRQLRICQSINNESPSALLTRSLVAMQTDRDSLAALVERMRGYLETTVRLIMTPHYNWDAEDNAEFENISCQLSKIQTASSERG